MAVFTDKSPARRRQRTGTASFSAPAEVRRFDEARYIPPVEELTAELEQSSCLMIDGGCGLGKSTRIREYLEGRVAKTPHLRILMLSVRVVHATNIMAEFTTEILKPKCYLNTPPHELLNEENSFVVLSWEQANKLMFDKVWDVVVLDEVRSGLDKIKYNSTLKDVECLDCIWDIMQRATTRIVADADCRFDTVVPRWLEFLQIKYVAWHVPYRRLKRTLSVDFYTKQDREKHVMVPFRSAVRDLATSEKLLVVTSTKSAAKAYARYCFDRDIEYVKYDGDSGTNKKDFEDPDSAWEDKQVVIYNTCVTVGVDPKRTTFKAMFMHTSFWGANWLSMFQAISRGNRHCGDEVYTIHALLTCKPPAIDALERRVDGEATHAEPTIAGTRRAVERQHHARQSAMENAQTEACTDTGSYSVPGLRELRALVQLTDDRHRSAATHWSEFQKCAEHQQWPIVMAATRNSDDMDTELSLKIPELQERMQLEDGVCVLHEMMAQEMTELDCDADRLDHLTGFMASATEKFGYENKGNPKYVETHHRTVVDKAEEGLYYLMRDAYLPNICPVFCEDNIVAELKKNGPKAKRIANATHLSRKEVHLFAALRIASEKEHIDIGGQASETLNSHECWRVFCDAMGTDHRILGDFEAPDGMITVLNREHCKQTLQGADYASIDRLLNAASLVGPAPTSLWKAVQQIARWFGLKASKTKQMIDGVRGCFSRVQFTASDDLHRLVEMQTLYDRRCTPHRRVPVSQWQAHCEELDTEAVERHTVEIVNLERLEMLANEDKPESLRKGSAQSTNWDNDIKRLNEMLTTGNKNSDGSLSFTTTYRRNHAVGRDVATNSLRSLQGCPKKFRGQLAAVYFHDLDLENCHYHIMVQVADAHGVPLSSVRYYVDNRDACLQTVRDFYGVSRKAAKDLFLSVLNGGAPWAWMHKFEVDGCLRKRLSQGTIGHPRVVNELQGEYSTIRTVMFDKYKEHVETLIAEISNDEPKKPFRWVGELDERRELPAETDEAFEDRVKRSAFSNLLQNEERLCLNAMIAELNRLDYAVGCKIYDGCLVRRKKDRELPASVIASCEQCIEKTTGLKMRLWEKCLTCGEKLADCTCPICVDPPK